MTVLLSGSLAYDTSCGFPGNFSSLLLPEEISHLNLTFLAESLNKDFGGCAGNIAWSMRLLGGRPLLIASLGRDADAYLAHLEKNGIRTEGISVSGALWSAQAFITADASGNQLTTFHLGAMAENPEIPEKFLNDAELFHIAPGGLSAMASHGRLARAHGIPYVFDPGQTTSQLSAESLSELLAGTFLLCLSEYEEKLLCRRLGICSSELVTPDRSMIVTRGSRGSDLFRAGCAPVSVPAAAVPDARHPVGAGDAFRGGLLFGLERKLSLVSCMRLGTVMASFKVQTPGSQNYRPSLSDIRIRYEKAWEESFPG